MIKTFFNLKEKQRTYHTKMNTERCVMFGKLAFTFVWFCALVTSFQITAFAAITSEMRDFYKLIGNAWPFRLGHRFCSISSQRCWVDVRTLCRSDPCLWWTLVLYKTRRSCAHVATGSHLPQTLLIGLELSTSLGMLKHSEDRFSGTKGPSPAAEKHPTLGHHNKCSSSGNCQTELIRLRS